jgi:hypothetical protein
MREVLITSGYHKSLLKSDTTGIEAQWTLNEELKKSTTATAMRSSEKWR